MQYGNHKENIKDKKEERLAAREQAKLHRDALDRRHRHVRPHHPVRLGSSYVLFVFSSKQVGHFTPRVAQKGLIGNSLFKEENLGTNRGIRTYLFLGYITS